jgi:hypothetical protein
VKKITTTCKYIILIILLVFIGKNNGYCEATIAMNLPETLSFAVTNGMTDVQIPINVSGFNGLVLDVIVPIEGASLTIYDPDGDEVPTPGGGDIEYIDGSLIDSENNLPGGVFFTQEIINPENGTWTAIVEFPEATENTVVMATIYSRTSYQVGVVIERNNFISGEDVSLGIIVLDGGIPISGLNPTITIEPQITSSETMSLIGVDDGSNPDGLANDGIYSTEFTFQTAAEYIISGEVIIPTSSGLIERKATQTVNVVDPSILINDLTTDYVYGNGGCISNINIDIISDVYKSGDFIFNVYLEDSGGSELKVSKQVELDEGLNTVNLSIEYDEFKLNLDDGPYALDKVEIFCMYNESFILAFKDHGIGEIYDISSDDLCADSIEIEESLEAVPIITDGYISSIELSFPIVVDAAGYYTISFKIIGNDGENIKLAGGYKYLSIGENVLTYSITADDFLSADGPYSVVSLLVTGNSGSAQLSLLGTTESYMKWQFYPLIDGDLDNDGDVDSNDRSIILEYRNNSVLSPGDRRDLNSDGIIDLKDARSIVYLQCESGECSENY